LLRTDANRHPKWISPIAIKAIARKLAVLYWRLMVKGSIYVERGIAHDEEQLKNQKKKLLNKLALELDIQLVP
jgi:transposase